uniref:THAP domain-containing protein 2-like n=1 Tax=Semicossyphus pulcher TaxID=241346 RepID=UPI0037E90054
MPHSCAAFACVNERSAKSKEQGITFHRFPKAKTRRQAWTAALRRKDYQPNDYSVVCSSHFKPEDFDMTGQTTRLKEGVTPSIFKFPSRRCKVPCKSRSSRTSQKAAAECPDVKMKLPEVKEESTSTSDHQYALDPVNVKKKLTEAQEKVETLTRDLRNARDRERRLKRTMKTLLEHLKNKNMLTEELQRKLDIDSG